MDKKYINKYISIINEKPYLYLLIILSILSVMTYYTYKKKGPCNEIKKYYKGDLTYLLSPLIEDNETIETARKFILIEYSYESFYGPVHDYSICMDTEIYKENKHLLSEEFANEFSESEFGICINDPSIMENRCKDPMMDTFPLLIIVMIIGMSMIMIVMIFVLPIIFFISSSVITLVYKNIMKFITTTTDNKNKIE